MLIEGLGLMVAGMGVVFAFLTLLVLAMNLSARFFENFAEEVPDTAPAARQSGAAVVQQSDNQLAEIAAAIAAVKACTG